VELQRDTLLFFQTLIDDIIDFTKIQFNKLDIHNSWFSLHGLVDEVLAMCKFQAKPKKITLESDIDFEQ
jgi:signal transduction histidine kinase